MVFIKNDYSNPPSKIPILAGMRGYVHSIEYGGRFVASLILPGYQEIVKNIRIKHLTKKPW